MSGNRAVLSKSILEMKFMRKTKHKVEQQQYQEEGEEYFGAGLTDQMKKDSDRFIIEPSYMFCEKLTDGRVSYQGMNPEIEKFMEAEQADERMLLEKKKETDVSDEQMAEQWKSFRNKQKPEQTFQKNQQKDKSHEPSRKKRKFLKPQD